jgi:hypothetical protein
LTQAYIAGEAGVFIELTWSTNVWQSYKRKVSRIIDAQDEFILVDDIQDMFKTRWNNITGSYSLVSTSDDFRDS